MRVRRALLPVLLIVALAVGLTAVISFLPKTWIQTPFLILFGLLQSVLNNLPQLLVWALLLATLLFAALSTLPHERAPSQNDEPRGMRYHSGVSKWRRLIDQSTEGPYFIWRLSSALRDLALDLLSFTEKRPVDELWQELQSGEEILPNGQQEFIQLSLEERSLSFSERTEQPDLDLDLDSFIKYLENRLEGRGER